MLMAAQDQALRTNAIKSSIDKRDVSLVCRMCGKRAEPIAHVVNHAWCQNLAFFVISLYIRHKKIIHVSLSLHDDCFKLGETK